MPRKPPKPRRGRPPKVGDDATTVVHVRLDGRDLADVRRIAKQCDPPTTTEAIRQAVRDYALRLDLKRMARGLPVVSDGGPITRP